MSDLETRSVDIAVEYREADDRGYLEGIAMREGEITTIRNTDGTTFRERFEKNAIEAEGTVWLYSSHKHPVGEVVHSEYRDDGYFIGASLAKSDLAISTREQLKNGAITGLSVGFVPLEFRMEGDLKVITRARLREVSVTPNPAYPGAIILDVREDSTPTQGEKEMTDSVTPADVVELRSAIEDIDRKIETLSTETRHVEEPAVDTRSAGEVLKALVTQDADTIASVTELQTRAYTGGTTADAPLKNAWVGDLTRIFDNSSGVLAGIFETGALPSDGLTIEYGQLKSNTMTVTEQANQGDDLPYGKVTLETKTAPVKTYGGYTSLSRQAIERSSLPLLNRSLEALSQAAGKRAKAELRAAFNAAVTERSAIASNGGVVVLGATLAAANYNNWVNAIVDAAGKFDEEALNIDALVVSRSVFKKMASYAGSDGRPLLSLDGSGANTVGRLNITALNGSFAGIPVILDGGLTGDSATLVNGRAIRVYQSGLVSLQDENIVNLTKDFSVYRYAAIATEIPAGIVPVKLAAS